MVSETVYADATVQSVEARLVESWKSPCAKRKPAFQRWSVPFRMASVWLLRSGVSQQSRSYDTAAVAELTLTNWQPRESSLVWPETESGGLRSSTIPRLAAASSDLTASCIEDAHAPRYVRSI